MTRSSSHSIGVSRFRCLNPQLYFFNVFGTPPRQKRRPTSLNSFPLLSPRFEYFFSTRNAHHSYVKFSATFYQNFSQFAHHSSSTSSLACTTQREASRSGPYFPARFHDWGSKMIPLQIFFGGLFEFWPTCFSSTNFSFFYSSLPSYRLFLYLLRLYRSLLWTFIIYLQPWPYKCPLTLETNFFSSKIHSLTTLKLQIEK